MSGLSFALWSTRRRRRRLREAFHEWWRILFLVTLLALGVIVAEDHAPILRFVLHCRRAIGGCGLLTCRHVVEPDAAHARGRPTFRRNCRRLLVTAPLRASDMRRRERRGAQKSQSYRESLHLSSIDTDSGAHLTRARPVPHRRPSSGSVNISPAGSYVFGPFARPRIVSVPRESPVTSPGLGLFTPA